MLNTEIILVTGYTVIDDLYKRELMIEGKLHYANGILEIINGMDRFDIMNLPNEIDDYYTMLKDMVSTAKTLIEGKKE